MTPTFDEVDFYLKDLESRFKGLDSKYGYENYYLSYSGGKDSHLLYWFIKEWLKDDKIKIVAVNTYMELPQIRERMYKYADIVLLPTMKPFEIKAKYGIPCFSKLQDGWISRWQNGVRTQWLTNVVNGKGADGKAEKGIFSLSNKAMEFAQNPNSHKVTNKCCKYLKKEPMAKYGKQSGKKAIMGVRGNESAQRKQSYQTCFTKAGNFTPLYDLTDEIFNGIYERYQIEIPPIYKIISRTGCMGCPYGSWKRETSLELELLNDNQFKFVTEYFKESYKVLGIDTKNRQTKLDI